MQKIRLVESRDAGVTVDGRRFRAGQVVEVPDKLAAELLKGSDRLEGYTFKKASKKDEKEAAEAAADTGGIAGQGPPLPDPAGTTTSQAR